MIVDATNRNTKRAANQKFVRKIKLGQVLLTVSQIGKFKMSITSFQVTQFCFPLFRTFFGGHNNFAVKTLTSSYTVSRMISFFQALLAELQENCLLNPKGQSKFFLEY